MVLDLDSIDLQTEILLENLPGIPLLTEIKMKIIKWRLNIEHLHHSTEEGLKSLFGEGIVGDKRKQLEACIKILKLNITNQLSRQKSSEKAGRKKYIQQLEGVQDYMQDDHQTPNPYAADFCPSGHSPTDSPAFTHSSMLYELVKPKIEPQPIFTSESSTTSETTDPVIYGYSKQSKAEPKPRPFPTPGGLRREARDKAKEIIRSSAASRSLQPPEISSHVSPARSRGGSDLSESRSIVLEDSQAPVQQARQKHHRRVEEADMSKAATSDEYSGRGSKRGRSRSRRGGRGGSQGRGRGRGGPRAGRLRGVADGDSAREPHQKQESSKPSMKVGRGSGRKGRVRRFVMGRGKGTESNSEPGSKASSEKNLSTESKIDDSESDLCTTSSTSTCGELEPFPFMVNEEVMIHDPSGSEGWVIGKYSRSIYVVQIGGIEQTFEAEDITAGFQSGKQMLFSPGHSVWVDEKETIGEVLAVKHVVYDHKDRKQILHHDDVRKAENQLFGVSSVVNAAGNISYRAYLPAPVRKEGSPPSLRISIASGDGSENFESVIEAAEAVDRVNEELGLGLPRNNIKQIDTIQMGETITFLQGNRRIEGIVHNQPRPDTPWILVLPTRQAGRIVNVLRENVEQNEVCQMIGRKVDVPRQIYLRESLLPVLALGRNKNHIMIVDGGEEREAHWSELQISPFAEEESFLNSEQQKSVLEWLHDLEDRPRREKTLRNLNAELKAMVELLYEVPYKALRRFIKEQGLCARDWRLYGRTGLRLALKNDRRLMMPLEDMKSWTFVKWTLINVASESYV